MASDTVAQQPSQGLAAYRRVMAAPQVRPLVAFGLLARMPIGMGAVALILFIHGETGSFGIAGAVAGAYTVGLGITGPTVARLIDRLDGLFFDRQMSASTRQRLSTLIQALPGTNADKRLQRVKSALTLVALSPDHVIQK